MKLILTSKKSSVHKVVKQTGFRFATEPCVMNIHYAKSVSFQKNTIETTYTSISKVEKITIVTRHLIKTRCRLINRKQT